MLVYKITNKSNHKSYIGKTKNTLAKRWQYHCYSALYNSNGILHKAIRKYGRENFTLEILHDGIDTNIECSSIEIFYISFYGTFGCGYNLTKGGDGGSMYSWTPKHRKNQSDRMMGKNNPMYKKTHLPEAKKLIGDASSLRNKGKGNPNSKTWKITSPLNEVFIIVGGIDKFAKDHKLSPWSLSEMGRKNRTMRSGSCYGWKCEILT